MAESTPGSLNAPNQKELFDSKSPSAPATREVRLHASVLYDEHYIALVWLSGGTNRRLQSASIECVPGKRLQWTLRQGRTTSKGAAAANESAIRSQLRAWAEHYPAAGQKFEAVGVRWSDYGTNRRQSYPLPPLPAGVSPWEWLAQQFQGLARDFQQRQNFDFGAPWLSLTEERRIAEAARLRQNQEVAEQEQRERERKRAVRLEKQEKELGEKRAREAASRPQGQPAPLPPVPIRIEPLNVALQETALQLSDLAGFNLQEKASLWWTSNQTDNLLCLPYCRIERLEYQVRSALRVLGALRGRALLSDEVGLGKTIEAGLVLKELLMRGLVKRFLVLTVPSLVDQWEAELGDKFGLAVATTNSAAWRDNEGRFWQDNPAIVASLHTVKQPAQLEAARQVKWDLLVVDEAHYLRNRESQAWQAVNLLPRQFLLLLTATPVQNSLEELYNLVTLLQPGQLPPPKEFRKRFIDPKRPRQPREPEELRRLLGQVMIRNTRANAGLNLPPRRAETVLFAHGAGEQEFWAHWEREFRKCLETLSPSQASLWGRLLLQAAGSSPAAWRGALVKFPERQAAKAWREESPLEESWVRKCELLAPLAKADGGAVVFSQFLETQAAIAARLRSEGVPTFVINGATPAVERQPITEAFHQQGGALLLTHSGTEGRNLQFCHRLINFDLPWNPMEIEQRIGRLHRYGQQHPVHIYNFTQQDTLQHHLLEVLQEKLNLFELVVGETGLVLGERFDSEDFAEEVLRRWRGSEGKIAEAMASLGVELEAARGTYEEVKRLDETLFADDYASDL